MKKLLVLAAVAAMAMGAKAAYYAGYDDFSLLTLSVTATQAGSPVDAYPLGYNNFYVLMQNDFATWEQSAGGLTELAAASWMVGTPEEFIQEAHADWYFYYKEASYGSFSKQPKYNGDQVEVPFDPTQDADLIFVAANNEGDYYSANMYYRANAQFYSDLSGTINITVDSPTPVPEPTSGLLLLVGLGALALRRRRA